MTDNFLLVFLFFSSECAVKNSKELELAMWKRRASYDPLKAAAEGKKKADEAKRTIQQQMMMSTDR